MKSLRRPGRLSESLLLCALLWAHSAFASKPNVIVLLADDLGWGDVGFHGSEIATPALDSLAAAGQRFERFYVQPTCSPTRAALMTGRSNLRLGVIRPIDKNMQGGLPMEEKLLPQYLQEAGYQTWLVGKWHLGHAYRKQLPDARGFDYTYGNLLGGVGYWDHVHGGGLDWQRNGYVVREEGYTTDLLTADALRLLRERDRDQPFFMYLSYTAPHLPNEAPEARIQRYGGIDNPHRQVHAAMVEIMDDGIGEILAELERQGISGDTVIWFMSDNGGLVPEVEAHPGIYGVLQQLSEWFEPPWSIAALEFLRSNFMEGGSDNGSFRQGKGSVYEGGVRVPSVVAWPGTLQPGTVAERARVYDVLPTLLDFAGIDAVQSPMPLDGVSLRGSLLGLGPVAAGDYATQGMDGSRAYYQGAWKLLLSSSGDAALYNLEDDPTEQQDLAAEQPERVAALSERLARFPRGEVVHETSVLEILLDPDAFGGVEDRPPWVEMVRD